MEQPMIEQLARDARRGRLVAVVGSDMLAPETARKVRALPCGVWVAAGVWPDADEVIGAAEVEEGERRCIPRESIVVMEGIESLGTPRRPTRVRAWLVALLRLRTALFLGAGPEIELIRRLAGQQRRSRHVAAAGEEAGALLDTLLPMLERAPKARPLEPPPLPGVASRAGLIVVALAAAVAVVSWLALYLSYSGARNWRWLHALPLTAAVAAVVAALAPWMWSAAAGRELPASECYARALARWSRWPRVPLAAAALVVAALGAGWLAARYVPATFLVIYEAAGVTANGRDAGSCKAEEPCTLIVPRGGRLGFDGAEGACVMDLDGASGLIIIDMDEGGCEVPPENETETKPRTG